jgi:hypothetical protein
MDPSWTKTPGKNMEPTKQVRKPQNVYNVPTSSQTQEFIQKYNVK